jgi:alkylmercury lyase
MCAIDALGLPAMTGRDGRIISTDPHDGAPIVVSVRDGAWSWTPASAVVVMARDTGCGAECRSFEDVCPNTVFHASSQAADAYLAGHDRLDAEVMDQDAAIERGRWNFGSLLTEPA